MKNQCNGMKDDDDVKLLWAYIKKMQFTSEVRILASNEMTSSSKGIVGRKGTDIGIRKVSYITD